MQTSITDAFSKVKFRHVALVAIALLVSAIVRSQPVTLEVSFRLTDLDYKPLGGVPVRLVFGSEPDWQGANSGHRFVTDANGGARLSVPVILDKRLRKAPTNFVDSLLARPQPTDHLMVGAELPYMTFRWLYTVDLARFPKGGDVVLDDFSVYTPDAQARYTHKAKQDGNGWTMPELAPLVLTHAGYEPWDYLLDADPGDPTGRRWTLRIAFKQRPPPVRR